MANGVEENPVLEVRAAERDKIRLRIKELKKNISTQYVEMGEHLSKVLEERLFIDFGFSKFAEYVDKEVDFKQRKALYLVGIFRKFVQEIGLKGEDFSDIDWSKMAQICRVANRENYQEWLDKARKLGIKELTTQVRIELGDEDEEEAEQDLHKFVVHLFAPQLDIVNQAFKKAERVENNSKRNVLFERICMDYLTTDISTEDEALRWYLTHLARAYRVNITAVGASTGTTKAEIVYEEVKRADIEEKEVNGESDHLIKIPDAEGENEVQYE